MKVEDRMPYCDLDSLLGLFANPRTRGGKMCKYSRLYIRKISPFGEDKGINEGNRVRSSEDWQKVPKRVKAILDPKTSCRLALGVR